MEAKLRGGGGVRHGAAAAERVNDFAPLFVKNLLRKAVVISG